MHSIIVSLEIFSIIHLPHKYIPVTIQAQLSDRIFLINVLNLKCTLLRQVLKNKGACSMYVFTYLDILTYIKGQTETKMQHEKFDN